MQYLHPWLMAMKHHPDPFAEVMQELGFEIEEEWIEKKSVVRAINHLCRSNFTQKAIWGQVYDSRKSSKEYNFLFPDDPLFQRKRNFCHFYEAWYTIALFCSKNQCLDQWLRHFNLSEDGEILRASQVIFTNTIIVNGIHIEGSGVIKL
jgi:hypothetical protein